MFNRFLGLLVLCTGLQVTAFDNGQSISFDELFVLDRAKALQELIPGSDTYYHYYCLHYQSTGERDKFDEMMTAWFKKHKHSHRYKVMLNRQALIDYNANPRKSLDHIIKELNLKFNHQKIAEQRKVQYPNELDQVKIDWDVLKNRSVHRITDAGLEAFSKKDLDADTRRYLLKRIKSPSFPNLVKLIIDDLNAPKAGTFGYHQIHNNLTKEQMDELAKLKPELKNYSTFVHNYLKRLRPASHINWEQNPENKGKYLDSLWSFVKDLKPSFNSLKANILLHKLNHGRSLDKYDEDLFIEYLKLPRNVHYINPKYRNKKEFRNSFASLNSDFSHLIGCKPLGRIEGDLVMDYF